MGSLANSSSLQTTIQDEIRPLPLSAFSQLSLLTLKPSPRLRLRPIMAIMDMAWPTTGTVMVWLTMVTMVHMPILMVLMDTTMARGLLMPSPLPRPMPFMVPMVTMVWVTEPTDTATLTLTIMDTTTARGPLMLSPLLTPFMVPMAMAATTVWATWVTEVMLDTLTDTTDTDTDTITKLLLFCSRIEEFAM